MVAIVDGYNSLLEDFEADRIDKKEKRSRVLSRSSDLKKN